MEAESLLNFNIIHSYNTLYYIKAFFLTFDINDNIQVLVHTLVW
jgi:hypothetical protein